MLCLTIARSTAQVRASAADGAAAGGDDKPAFGSAEWRTRPAAVRVVKFTCCANLLSLAMNSTVPIIRHVTDLPGVAAGVGAQSWGVVCAGRLREDRRADDVHGNLTFWYFCSAACVLSSTEILLDGDTRPSPLPNCCTAGGFSDLLIVVPVAIGNVILPKCNRNCCMVLSIHCAKCPMRKQRPLHRAAATPFCRHVQDSV